MIQCSPLAHLPNNGIHLIRQILRKLSEGGAVSQKGITGQSGAVLGVVLRQQVAHHFRAGQSCAGYSSILVVCLRATDKVNQGCTAILLVVLLKFVIPLLHNAGNKPLKLGAAGKCGVPLIFKNGNIIINVIKTIIGRLNGLRFAHLVGTVLLAILNVAGHIAFGNVAVDIGNLAYHIAVLFLSLNQTAEFGAISADTDIGAGQHLGQGVSHLLIANALCHGGNGHIITGCKLGNNFLPGCLLKCGIQHPSSLFNAQTEISCVNRHIFIFLLTSWTRRLQSTVRQVLHR